jgi:hypothetical protein
MGLPHDPHQPPRAALRGLCVRQKRQVWVPLCPAHENHWQGRKTFAWVSFLLFFIGGAILGLLVAFTSNDPDKVAIVIGLLFLVLVVWLVVVLIVQSGAIRAIEFSKRAIRLANVSRAFVEAYEDDREGPRRDRDRDRFELDDDVRQHWSDRQSSRDLHESQDHVRDDQPEEGSPRKSDKYRPE